MKEKIVFKKIYPCSCGNRYNTVLAHFKKPGLSLSLRKGIISHLFLLNLIINIMFCIPTLTREVLCDAIAQKNLPSLS